MFQVRRLIQLAIILYVGLYALWLQRGYQEFANVESSVTIKIKGVTKSFLDKHSTENEGNLSCVIQLNQCPSISMTLMSQNFA